MWKYIGLLLMILISIYLLFLLPYLFFWLPIFLSICFCYVYFIAIDYYNKTREARFDKDFLSKPFNIGFAIAAFMLPALIERYDNADLVSKPALLSAITLILVGITTCLWAIFSMPSLKTETDGTVELDSNSFTKLRVIALVFLLVGTAAFTISFTINGYNHLTGDDKPTVQSKIEKQR